MNWADFVILGLIAVSALIGLARGLVREVLSLVIWASALLVAWVYFSKLEVYLESWIAAGTVRMAAAFVVLLVLVLLAGVLIGHLFSVLVERSGLTGTDRLLGGLFGAVRGGLIVAMAVFLAALTPLPEDGWWKEAALIGRFQVLAERVLGEVPPGIIERVKQL
jgi:membrane protein required for colicin V production